MNIKSERTKKTLLNTISVLALEIVTVLSGLILPRLILSNFGSATNGLVSSVNQFITCVTLLRAGVGGVTRAALYKPLADHDTGSISCIVSATNRFMRKLTIQYTVLLMLFAAIYPLAVQEEFDWLYASSMVLILGMSTFFDCCFGVTYQFLLQADQKRYVISIIQIFTILVNALTAVLLMLSGASIHAVKFGSSLVYSVKPLILYFYVHKTYSLDWKAQPDNTVIKQRWDAFAHQVAAFITTNTDIMVLTFLSNMKVVSIYSIYNMIILPLRNLVSSLASGIEAAFGNMIAKNEEKNLRDSFSGFELFMFMISTWVFSCAGCLITPFVSVYTSGVTDINYNQPLFGYILCLAQFLFCIRMPYQILVETSGHFKQTRNGAFLEAGLNLLVSIVMVRQYGLIGVAVGTAVALLVRTIQYVFYVNRFILSGCLKSFVKHIICCFLSVLIAGITIQQLPAVQVTGFGTWILYAFQIGIMNFITLIGCYGIFYRKRVFEVVSFFRRKKR